MAINFIFINFYTKNFAENFMDQISGTDIQEIEISCFFPNKSATNPHSDFTSALAVDEDSEIYHTLTERKNYHLELTTDSSRHSLPLILRASSIYTSTSTAVLDNYRAFSTLQTLIREWFTENPTITSERNFQLLEKKNLLSIGSAVFTTGYLLIFIRQKTY